MKLMLALDVEDKETAIRILDNVIDYIDAIKVGYPLVLPYGIKILKEIKRYNKEIICDFKLADIPATNEKIAKISLKYADGIIAHGFVGEDSLKAVIEIAKNMGKKTAVVVEMSHPGAVRYMQPIAEDLALLAKNLKADYIVAPSTRPKRLKKLKEISSLPVMTPGIITQGGKIEEIKDILDEKDYIIVGRAIYQANNPKESAKQIKDLIG
ncbi:orotidine 5'-phosphate decarboxylase [Methanocaldococcus villosus KIN24-T80]|uniref:Orotidine 5'-phosphate decarboxylase n=1 Tax=Methanocaldococcus villosus KIN24-T80 TaxID=1069083 RepID=N6UTJ4_9EURY|nr:orotidine-5'-phosphate decarboxylase [Methanocaldococcus villosus]ENN95644.1 orotidine 5'-phosphate decarboxylase [Methanocaldococcus villosus KIN24-T80]